jgi:hypothetical protein
LVETAVAEKLIAVMVLVVGEQCQVKALEANKIGALHISFDDIIGYKLTLGVVGMETKKIGDIDAFKRESDKARNLSISKEDVDRINEICREVEVEENEIEDSNLSIVAKEKESTSSSHA